MGTLEKQYLVLLDNSIFLSWSPAPPLLAPFLSWCQHHMYTVINAVNDYAYDASEQLLQTLLNADRELDPVALRRVRFPTLHTPHVTVQLLLSPSGLIL